MRYDQGLRIQLWSRPHHPFINHRFMPLFPSLPCGSQSLTNDGHVNKVRLHAVSTQHWPTGNSRSEEETGVGSLIKMAFSVAWSQAALFNLRLIRDPEWLGVLACCLNPVCSVLSLILRTLCHVSVAWKIIEENSWDSWHLPAFVI